MKGKLLFMHKSWLIIAGFFFISCSAQEALFKAYSFYLVQQYDSAYCYYTLAVQENQNDTLAYEGLMNCLIVKRAYARAIRTGIQALEKTPSFAIYRKTLWLLAINNNRTKLNHYYASASKLYGPGKKSDFLLQILSNDIAYGYYVGGSLHKAEVWFKQAAELDPGNRIALEGITAVKKAKKEAFIPQINGNAGYVAYSKSAAMDNGWIYGATVSLLKNQAHRFSLSYTHTGITMKTVQIAIPADTLYYGLKIYPPVSEVGPNQKHLIDTVPFFFDGKWDTAYYPYDTFRIQSPSQNPGYDKYDTVYTPEINRTEKPRNLYQDEYYFSYANYFRLLPHTRLLVAARYARSNMLLSEQNATLCLGHTSRTKYLEPASVYALTYTDHNLLLQVSPYLTYKTRFVETGIGIHGLARRQLSSTSQETIPGFQFSYEMHAALHIPHVNILAGGFAGNRIFLCESDGLFLNNSTVPVNWGIKSMLEITLFKNSTVVYSLLRYTDYETYNSFAVVGGVFFQW